MMKQECYERTSLVITEFEQEDVIVTSGENFSLAEYEHLIEER